MRPLPGTLLVLATLIALSIANSPLEHLYHSLFEAKLIKDFSVHMFVNDFLMAIFFLSVGCEIKKEILDGHLSDLKKASFPVISAVGGVIVPAIIFMVLNAKTDFITGFGVPISTDIAFAVGVFMIFQKYLNPTLKVFLLSLAVVDDLMSIVVIGVFYSSDFNFVALAIAAVILVILMNVNKFNKNEKITPYVIGGLLLWYFIYLSGVHATISGVLLAACLPYHKDRESLCKKTEHFLSPICNYAILPLFAFSNTGINLNIDINFAQNSSLILGIVCGLVIGKPVGITLFSFIGQKLGIVEITEGTNFKDIMKVGILAGIGFTMSIFVSELAFAADAQIVSIAKISILMSSVLSCTLGYLFIVAIPKLTGKSQVTTQKEAA